MNLRMWAFRQFKSDAEISLVKFVAIPASPQGDGSLAVGAGTKACPMNSGDLGHAGREQGSCQFATEGSA